MQPHSPQPQYGPPPGGPAPWGGAPGRARANAAAALTAGVLALITAGLLVWFVVINIGYGTSPEGGWSALTVQNVFSGVLGAGALLVTGGLTFARRVPGAWALAGLCALYVVATFAAPLLRGTPLRDQITWIFGFDKSNGVAVGLTMIFGILTATFAAIAAGAKTYEPTGR
ncbi:hypothetical protein Afil01_32530 [Actinorhabdospora filicis]|uniref:Uncharacterized protein n=1 Tax=Actinorhabdospora filicis TaxID=1785913 RepID=A0A9W6SPN4_9ACTN|nr:hypothetical protein [Actinorhabdospora filicis]GLZ78446.1 hypothetical protein Afil01_32530 [Actinorhabdospora filicis]